jgi:hypothetical protein
MRGVKVLAVLLLGALLMPAPAALAQRERHAGPAKSNVTQEDRRRIREDVDSARGTYERREGRRPERMAPEERERLRQDVQDANREMRRRR